MTPGAAGTAPEIEAAGRLTADRPPAARTRPVDALGLTLLAAGIAIAWAVAKWMEVRGRTSDAVPAVPAFVGFLFCFALAFVAGRRARRSRPDSGPDQASPSRPLTRARVIAATVLGLASSAFFFATLVVERKEPVPLWTLGVWLASLVLAGAAFAAVSPRRPRAPVSRTPAVAPIVSLCLVVAAAAWLRLGRLGHSPAGFGGDEASQILDAFSLLDGTDPGANLFGTGWYSTMRLGMLPAGLAARTFTDPVGGPRFPYALVGALSVLAAAAAGWLVAGAWGGL